MKYKITKEGLVSLSYLLAIPGLKLIYFFLNRIPRPATSVLTWVDNYIPFIPVFVIPYIIFYPFVLLGLIYLFKNNREVYIHTVKAYSLGLVVCYLTYLFFQTTMPRPEVTGNDLFSKIVAWIYYIDEPYNALPSIHVLGTMITMLGLKEGKYNNLLVNFLGWSIIFSTVFVKQHGILDVIAALALSHFVFNTFTSAETVGEDVPVRIGNKGRIGS